MRKPDLSLIFLVSAMQKCFLLVLDQWAGLFTSLHGVPVRTVPIRFFQTGFLLEDIVMLKQRMGNVRRQKANKFRKKYEHFTLGKSPRSGLNKQKNQ